ncbi:PAS domain-containing protein [Sinorhizobium medicae]|uniref:histidine kinase n=1 Tax=Sinorhizobium medicae TaxID=110321 RepID=A0A508WP43_9HYPH|nr:PAS domain-containing protein [Sinorhizobium medicae]WQO54204.1 PAS domain-containing protein [Sinorhizobium medicae]VTZ59365.1 PAS domain-containing sensor histidine kinase [Sinorhizobium medicae]
MSFSQPLVLVTAALAVGIVAYMLTGMHLTLFLPIVALAHYVRGAGKLFIFAAFAVGLSVSAAAALSFTGNSRDQAVSWAMFFAVALGASAIIQGPAGFTPSEVAGQSAGMQGNKKAETATKFSGFVHPEDRDAAHQAASRAFWSGFPQVMKYRQIQPDGSYVWTEYRAEPGYSVAIDTPAKISAQHLPWTAPESLGETAEAAQIALVLETIFGTGWAMDTVGRFTYTTPNAQTTVGQTLAQMNEPLTEATFLDGGDLGWKRIFHPDEYERVAASLRHCLRTGDNWNNEYRLKRASTGEYGWYRVAMRPTRDSRGRVTGWYGMSIDITVYKQTETALRIRERELSQLIDMVPVHIMRLTGTGRPTFFSKGTLGFFALGDQYVERPEATLGIMRDAVHPDDAVRLGATLHQALNSGEPLAIRYRVRRADGIYRWMDSRAEPIRDGSGVIVQWYAVSLDVDDQVVAQDELRRAQEDLARASQAASLSELSASIAHEVAQPLAALLSSSEACQRWLAIDPPNVDRAQQALERIVRSGNAATDIVRRIRALFARSGGTREPTDLGRVVTEVHDLLAEELLRNDVKLEVEVENDLPVLALDRVQIQQVLINLLRNGVEAMGAATENRILRLAVEQAEDMVEIGVSDSGPGVEDPKKIFEPFFTTKRQGMGMGLAICRSIAEFHGGRLWVENSKPHGARFVFTLPILQDRS